MTPLFFQPHSRLSLTIIPDTMAHLDGHTIITRTYSIFKNRGRNQPLPVRRKESILHLGKIDDPDYLGYITFELPDKLFNYTSNGRDRLDSGEVEQIIEFLSDVRTNPGLWKNFDK